MQNSPPRYGWRLASLMAERKIRTAVELHRRLADVGYKITPSQITRIIYDRPQQVKTALLDALGRVFGCTMDEIMPVVDDRRVDCGPDVTAPQIHS